MVATVLEVRGREFRGLLGRFVLGLVRRSNAISIASKFDSVRESDSARDSELSGNGAPPTLCSLEPLAGCCGSSL